MPIHWLIRPESLTADCGAPAVDSQMLSEDRLLGKVRCVPCVKAFNDAQLARAASLFTDKPKEADK